MKTPDHHVDEIRNNESSLIKLQQYLYHLPKTLTL